RSTYMLAKKSYVQHASRKFLGPGSPEVLSAGHGDPAFFVLVKGWNRARSASDRIFLNGLLRLDHPLNH
ncbi:hypothetical protein K9M78_07205, partial [Candidatus Bipolaricaulota bacterium]|nr:hypothetical protein [Candidatus Bipolaricaulota bacterium]